MAQKIRSTFWLGFGLYLLFRAFSRYLHPSTDQFATSSIANAMSGILGASFVYGAYASYKRRIFHSRPIPHAMSSRTSMWVWLLFASLVVISMCWPLFWHFSLDIQLVGRIAILAYFLLEACEAYRGKGPQSQVRARGSIGLQIMGAIVIAFGLTVIGGGLWYANDEWSKITKWPRTTGVLVDKKFFRAGARLIFEYDVTGGRSAGRVDRYGGEEEMRNFLEPYRLGNNYPVSYNPQDASEVEFHLGYNWDLFRGPIAIVILGALFAAAGFVLEAPWRRAPGT
jgi:hypothetical protein